MTWLQWIDKHKGVAALLGGFCSVTAGATWWLAKGGAVALITSVSALSEPEIASTLAGLPDYHRRVEANLEAVQETQRRTQESLQQILDALEALRRETERVVEWAPEHSQRLTDAVGGCFAGEDCTVYFRGRLTQVGSSCVMVAAKPRLLLPDGREFPTRFSGDTDKLELSTRFETIETQVAIPPHIPPGLVGVVVMTIYAECPFVSAGEMVERETFRLLVEIKQPE
ncbi:hypothetical protein DSS3P1_37 [Ruegeria phage DSS3-P1]|uniref:hypothetical protein n=1 Tax=Ruegeria phage DSS3-P1 TaxID=1555208 RepID=UPI0002357D9A|nr:hypothetical protein DSS3P1_37 [Ruegeria phage DSS3-P1]YP_009997174.1 hypothetical protein JT311_gp40 [Ruegeria phage vB_RpoS-V16]YP_009997254.1 hypothetical protein JT312_gp37 [Ruegeria phage vB_RpoS-V18]YP_009997336.1 hypothetical protein JT313_gp37 [Ruegeria phage vB_RpoS-V11]YP_009997419.1 hypothetical protein JT314_gp38 [Ruegeria phage vB_RpoS-V7]AET42342.1 hypothetical protein SDSG_00077 [Ruegeria phage DSS3-P1]AIT13272.1 hypothetical protein DSS3P1_37 [Ruegeria phage DSS3-P1]AWY087